MTIRDFNDEDSKDEKLKDEDSADEYKGKMFCKYHCTCRHTTNECTTLKTLVKQAKQKKGKHFKKKKRHTKHEVNIMVKKHVKKVLKQKKRKCTKELHAFEKMIVSDSDQKSMNSSSSEKDEI